MFGHNRNFLNNLINTNTMTTVKTNSKAFNTLAYQYILDAINSEDIELNSDTEKLQYLANEFKSAANYEFNLKRYPNTQDRFADWIAGLPSSFSIDFTNYDILQLAVKWNSLADTTNEDKNFKVLNNWFNLIAFKVMQLMSKHNIDIHSTKK